MEDIGAKLYELIKAGFDKLSADDPLLKSIAERIRKGTASMEDVSQYAVRLGLRLSQAIRRNLSPEALPNGRMYYNIAEKILDPMLHESYDLVNLTAAQVQELVDTAAGIHIRPQQAAFPAERVQKAISAAAEPDIDWEKVVRRMTVPAANITASFADDFMETNAAFRAKAGFMTYIVRKDHSGCCGWCARQAGKYEYSSTPRDVYRRHDNCTCTVTYHTDGKRQQVWSKREWSDEQEQEYLKDLDEKKAEKRKALAERKELSEKSKPKRLTKKEAAEQQARVLDKSGGGGIINKAKVIDSMFYADDYEYQTYTKEEIIEHLKTSPVGLDTIRYLEENPQVKVMFSEDPEATERGQHEKNLLTIWLSNCPNVRVAAQTVVHEVAHHKYNIGGSQLAETICFAFEKMHKEGRNYLTQEEWDILVELAKNYYYDLPAVGGVDHLERFDFVVKKG